MRGPFPQKIWTEITFVWPAFIAWGVEALSLFDSSSVSSTFIYGALSEVDNNLMQPEPEEWRGWEGYRDKIILSLLTNPGHADKTMNNRPEVCGSSYVFCTYSSTDGPDASLRGYNHNNARIMLWRFMGLLGIFLKIHLSHGSIAILLSLVHPSSITYFGQELMHDSLNAGSVVIFLQKYICIHLHIFFAVYSLKDFLRPLMFSGDTSEGVLHEYCSHAKFNTLLNIILRGAVTLLLPKSAAITGDGHVGWGTSHLDTGWGMEARVSMSI